MKHQIEPVVLNKKRRTVEHCRGKIAVALKALLEEDSFMTCMKKRKCI